MPCLCVNCHEKCSCDELLCSACLIEACNKDAHEIYEMETEQLKERENKKFDK